MEKLADISAFESLGDTSSAVFNGAWNYDPATVSGIQDSCAALKQYADVVASLVEGEKRRYLYKMHPTKVLMLEEVSAKLLRLAENIHKDTVGASAAAERKHYRDAIAEQYPDIDLSDIYSTFASALHSRNKSRFSLSTDRDIDLDPDVKAWRGFDEQMIHPQLPLNADFTDAVNKLNDSSTKKNREKMRLLRRFDLNDFK